MAMTNGTIESWYQMAASPLELLADSNDQRQ